MRPLTVLLGILMGSSVAIALGLFMVLIIFLILSGEHGELEAEFEPLLESVALFTVLSAASVASFIGELRERSWRRYAQAGLAAGLALALWLYWPEG